MNNSGEAQPIAEAVQDMVAPVIKSMSTSENPQNAPFGQPWLVPFDPEIWDAWED